MPRLDHDSVTFVLAAIMASAGCTSPPASGGDPRYVTVGADGLIASSVDATAWTIESSGVAVSLAGIATGRSMFVAVGAKGTIVTSRDGERWTKQASPTNVDLSHVIFDGERFVAVGGDWDAGAITVKSSNGSAWEVVDSPASHMFHAVAHREGTLIAAAYYRSDLQTPALFTSTVGSGSSASSWTTRQGPDFFDSLTIGGEIIVVGGGTSVSMTRDGVAWSEHALATTALLNGIAFGGSTFTVVGERGTIHTSPDGVGWTERATLLGAGGWLTDITYGESLFVAVGSNGAIVTSPDGNAWTTQASGTSKHLSDAAYGPAR